MANEDNHSALPPANLLYGLEQKILENYRPEHWAALTAGLGVVCSLSLKERSHPLALIFEGPSGGGKSLVVNLFGPDREETHKFVYRLDAFTPKSFVSHAANISKDELKEIDLLPRISDKTLLTKELAPLFRGRDDELRTNFATLTSVLDGRGHLSASGTHGTRGYDGRYVFNWVGATTPVPQRTDAIMAQLGNRLLRYEIVGQRRPDEELIDFAMSNEPTTVEDSCRHAVNDVLLDHFKRHPVNSVDPNTIQLSHVAAEEMVRFAKLIAQGRVELERLEGISGEEFIAGTPEGPERIILLLKTLAQGLALLRGGTEIGSEDLAVLRHVAFSCLPSRRRQILRAVLTVGGKLTSTVATERLHISRPTVREMMRELAATEIVSLTQGNSTQPDVVALAEVWSWLLPPTDPDPPAESEMGVCAGTPAEI